MRLGLIARADNRGLGQQTFEFSQHMDCAKIMVVDCPSERPLPMHLERFPGAQVVDGFPTEADFREFFDGLDVFFTCETAYGPHHNPGRPYEIARQMGVKSVLQPNWELFDWADQHRRTQLTDPDLFAAPSLWHFDDYPEPKVHLPVPVATERFTPNERHEARRFLHIVGRPAMHHRNGTPDLLHALRFVKQHIQVTIRCQDEDYATALISSATPAPNVMLQVAGGDIDNYWDAYTGHDVLIMPRRYGGLCLPVNEALAAHMPVIMTDIEPNNLWLPHQWLVAATMDGCFHAHTNVDLYSANAEALARKIDYFVEHSWWFVQQRQHAALLADELSWESLKPVYEKTFAEL